VVLEKEWLTHTFTGCVSVQVPRRVRRSSTGAAASRELAKRRENRVGKGRMARLQTGLRAIGSIVR
jgi:hypothetical protein